ncbi:MAG: hypothetical protein AAF329_05700 [Cyanobacteria bacterium P01_A01_bin.17]
MTDHGLPTVVSDLKPVAHRVARLWSVCGQSVVSPVVSDHSRICPHH